MRRTALQVLPWCYLLENVMPAATSLKLPDAFKDTIARAIFPADLPGDSGTESLNGGSND